MLIDRGIVAGEIVSMKLTSGEEVMGKLVEENATGYKLSRPLMLSMSAQGIGMIPYMFTIGQDRDVTIFKSGVLALQTSERQFADQYIQGTTGIKVSG